MGRHSNRLLSILLGILGGVVIVPVMLFGTSGASIPVLPDLGACGPEDSERLAFEESWRAILEAETLPTDAQLEASGAVLVVDAARRTLDRIEAGKALRRLDGLPDPVAVAVETGGYLVTDGKEILRVSRDGSAEPLFRTDSSTITSLASDGETVWAVSVETGYTASYLHAVVQDGEGTHRLEGPAHVRSLSEGYALLTDVNAPFAVRLIDSEGRELAIEAPPAGLGLGPGVRSLGATYVGCGQIAQTLTDLRSDTRVVVMYSLLGTDLRFLRSSSIPRPLGLTHADPAKKRAVLVSDEDGTPTIIVLRRE